MVRPRESDRQLDEVPASHCPPGITEFPARTLRKQRLDLARALARARAEPDLAIAPGGPFSLPTTSQGESRPLLIANKRQPEGATGPRLCRLSNRSLDRAETTWRCHRSNRNNDELEWRENCGRSGLGLRAETAPRQCIRLGDWRDLRARCR